MVHGLATIETAHLGTSLAEPGILGRNCQITDNMQYVPTADGPARDSGDHDFRN